MANRKRRADPIDGLMGALAVVIVLTFWLDALSGATMITFPAAASAFLVIAGLMSARAARHSLSGWRGMSKYLIWRFLRFGPSIFASFGIWLLVEAALAPPGALAIDKGVHAFILENPASTIIFGALAGSVVYGAAYAAGLTFGRPGRARLAGLLAGLVAVLIITEDAISAFIEIPLLMMCAFTAGALLESINASSRVARALRRWKLRFGAEIEAIAFGGIVLLVFIPAFQASPFCASAIATCLLFFLRRRARIADFLASPVMQRIGALSLPLLASAGLLVWPVREFVQSEAQIALLPASAIFVCAAVCLAWAFQRIIEEPVRSFAMTMSQRITVAKNAAMKEA